MILKREHRFWLLPLLGVAVLGFWPAVPLLPLAWLLAEEAYA